MIKSLVSLNKPVLQFCLGLLYVRQEHSTEEKMTCFICENCETEIARWESIEEGACAMKNEKD